MYGARLPSLIKLLSLSIVLTAVGPSSSSAAEESSRVARAAKYRCESVFSGALKPYSAGDVEAAMTAAAVNEQATRISDNNYEYSFAQNWALPNFSEADFSDFIKLSDKLPLPDQPRVPINFNEIQKVSLSLENGRQKLDFARINFSRNSLQQSREVLKNYLDAATKNLGLNVLIFTDVLDGDVEAVIKLYPLQVQRRFTLQESLVPIEIWAQDGTKPLDRSKTTLNLSAERYQGANQEFFLGQQVAPIQGLPFELQGGDIVVGDRHVLVGLSEIQDVQKAFGNISEIDAAEILSHLFGKPVLPLYLAADNGDRTPWSFHIDLDVVLAVDRNTNTEVALVRSPEAFMEAMSGMKFTPTFGTYDSKVTVEQIRTMRKRILERYAAGDFGSSFSTGTRSFLKILAYTNPLYIAHSIWASRMFKKQMRIHGYRIEDVPGFGEVNLNGKRASPNQMMFFGTNAILSGRFAYIPNNAMPELDRMIEAVYKKLGYEVIPMDSSSKTICYEGGIRCATETYRKPYLRIAPERDPNWRAK
jgi:hypothetical protein